MMSTVVELNQQNDSSLASESTKVKNSTEDSVPVLNLCDEKNKEAARKCNHFSIRGYVSEVRKRDPKHCYPFTLKDSTDPRNELPPMVVPNFRWWRCISCVPEAKNDILKDSRGAANGDQAQNVVNPGASVLLAGLSSKVNNAARVRNTEASTSIDSNDDKNYSLISADRKGKGKAHVNDVIPMSSSGFENGFPKVSSSPRIPQQTTGQVEVHLSTDNEVERRPIFNQNGTIATRHKDSKAGRTEVGPSEGYVTHEVDHVPKTCQGEPTDAVARIVSGSHSHGKSLVNLPDLNELNGEPSYEVYNAATVPGNNNNNFCDDDDYLGAERRKKPKVRLLSELLGLKKPQLPAKRKKKILSSASSQDDYVKLKRVDFQYEVLKSMEIGKSVGTSKMSESQYGSDSDDVSTEIISKALDKRRCKSKDPLLEKKNKRIKLDQGDSSSLFKQKAKHKSSHGKGNSEELPQNLDFFTRLSEKNSVLTKKRGTVSQAQKEPTSLVPSKSRMPNECETIQKVCETDQNGTENVRKASENGYYSLGSYLNKENDQLCVPRKDGLCVPSSQAEQKDKENTNVPETSVTFKLTSGSPPLIENQFVTESNICLTANSSEKKIGTPETDGHRSLPRHMPMQVSNPVANPKEQTNEARGRIQDIDINSIPSDDKTNEQGVADDIPMDIVELMAKNQYERHLDQPKDKHVISQPPDLSGTYVRQNGIGSYGQQMQNLAQFHFLNMKKPPLTDPRIPLFTENSSHSTYNSRNNVGVRGLLRENVVSGRFPFPSQALEHIRPYSAHTVIPNNWNRNLNAAIGQKYPPNFLHKVDSYQKHRGMVPRLQSTNEWPSGMTSRMPLGITNPQMISQSSNVLNKGRINHQTSGSFLNFEKQHNLNFSNAYNGNGNPECSARLSVDVNEAIPAMHLLSLMQNAAKMQNTDLSLGPQKVMMSPTSSRCPFPKNNNCRTTAEQDNSRHPCYPTARPFPLTYQNDGVNIGKTSAGFMGHIPLTLRGQRNIESTHFGPPSGDHRPLRRSMGPPRNKRKAIASMSKPAYADNHVQAMKHSLNLQCGEKVRCSGKTVSLAPNKVICHLNQNPSEFNDLRLVAQYMIGPENLKPRKPARDDALHPRVNSKRQKIKVNKPIISLTPAKS